MKLLHREQLAKLAETIKENLKYINTFSNKPIFIDKPAEKQSVDVDPLKPENGSSEFV